jgi:hypothetical protein
MASGGEDVSSSRHAISWGLPAGCPVRALPEIVYRRVSTAAPCLTAWNAVPASELELAVVIDAVPADLAEGAEDRRNRLLLFFALTVFDGGGAAETAV